MEDLRSAYRDWATRQPGMMVFAKPEWLDLVAPDWKICGGEGWFWPYQTKKRAGLNLVQLPACTRYLGPIFSDPRVYDQLPELPPQVDYALYTVHDPIHAFRKNIKLRAMASLVYEFSSEQPYSKSARWRVNKGLRELRIESYKAEDATAVRELLATQQENVPPGTERVFEASIRLGLGQAFCAFDGDRLVGWLWLVYDQHTAYLVLQLRHTHASGEVAPTLADHALAFAKTKGCQRLNFCAGFFPGIHKFYWAMGGRPLWYGQVRATRGVLAGGAEWIRSRINRNRI